MYFDGNIVENVVGALVVATIRGRGVVLAKAANEKPAGAFAVGIGLFANDWTRFVVNPPNDDDDAAAAAAGSVGNGVVSVMPNGGNRARLSKSKTICEFLRCACCCALNDNSL